MISDSKARKGIPMARGLLDYFPDALAEVARLSKAGNDKHNPGEEIHWSRGKSMDHADCIIRHLVERGTVDEDDGFLHEVKVAWRALALLQEKLEELGAPMPRAARLTPTEPTQYVAGSASPVEVPPPASERPLQGSSDSPTPEQRLEALRAVDPGFATLVEGRVVDLGREPLTLRDITDTEESPAWKDLKGFQSLPRDIDFALPGQQQALYRPLYPYTPPYRSDSRPAQGSLRRRPRRPNLSRIRDRLDALERQVHHLQGRVDRR